MNSFIKGLLIAVCFKGNVYSQPSLVTFNERPRNTATLASETVVLHCQFDITGLSPDNVEWQLLGLGASPVRIGYNGNISDSDIINNRGGTSKYFIDVIIDGNLRGYDLHVNDTNREDNYYHQCRAIRDDKASTALILILKEASCGRTPVLHHDVHEITLLENDSVNLTCSVPFHGQWSPLVTWSGVKSEDDFGVLKGTGKEGDWNMIWGIQSTGPLNSSYNGARISCKVNFTDPPPGIIDPGPGFDQDPPDYKDFCNIFLNILYQVRNVATEPPVEERPFVVNETLLCTAEGNPEPEITWEKMDGEGLADIDGPRLMITESMADNVHHYNCTALNTIGNITYVSFKLVQLTVDPLPVEPTTPEQSTLQDKSSHPAHFTTVLDIETTKEPVPTSAGLPGWGIALIIIAIVALLAALLIGLIFQVYRYRTKTKQKTAIITEREKKKQLSSTPSEYIPHANYGSKIVETSESGTGDKVNPSYQEEAMYETCNEKSREANGQISEDKQRKSPGSESGKNNPNNPRVLCDINLALVDSIAAAQSDD